MIWSIQRIVRVQHEVYVHLICIAVADIIAFRCMHPCCIIMYHLKHYPLSRLQHRCTLYVTTTVRYTHQCWLCRGVVSCSLSRSLQYINSISICLWIRELHGYHCFMIGLVLHPVNLDNIITGMRNITLQLCMLVSLLRIKLICDGFMISLVKRISLHVFLDCLC